MDSLPRGPSYRCAAQTPSASDNAKSVPTRSDGLGHIRARKGASQRTAQAGRNRAVTNSPSLKGQRKVRSIIVFGSFLRIVKPGRGCFGSDNAREPMRQGELRQRPSRSTQRRQTPDPRPFGPPMTKLTLETPSSLQAPTSRQRTSGTCGLAHPERHTLLRVRTLRNAPPRANEPAAGLLRKARFLTSLVTSTGCTLLRRVT